jgi:hypothetical protein
MPLLWVRPAVACQMYLACQMCLFNVTFNYKTKQKKTKAPFHLLHQAMVYPITIRQQQALQPSETQHWNTMRCVPGHDAHGDFFFLTPSAKPFFQASFCRSRVT